MCVEGWEKEAGGWENEDLRLGVTVKTRNHT